MKEVIKILRENVMSKWIQTLIEWLNIMESMPTPDEKIDTIDEIVLWYRGWKSFIPEDIRSLTDIEDVFKIALVLINEKIEQQFKGDTKV